MCLDRGLADDKLPVAHLRVRRSIPGEEFPPFCVERLMQRSIQAGICLLYTSPSPRDKRQSRMPSSA